MKPKMKKIISKILLAAMITASASLCYSQDAKPDIRTMESYSDSDIETIEAHVVGTTSSGKDWFHYTRTLLLDIDKDGDADMKIDFLTMGKSTWMPGSSEHFEGTPEWEEQVDLFDKVKIGSKVAIRLTPDQKQEIIKDNKPNQMHSWPSIYAPHNQHTFYLDMRRTRELQAQGVDDAHLEKIIKVYPVLIRNIESETR